MDYIPSNHPLTPPHTPEDRTLWLRLLRSRRVGVSTFYKLMAQHGSAHAALEALPTLARSSGVADYNICPQGVADAELKAGRRAGASLVAIGEQHYPRALALIPDAPPLLWMKGDFSVLERPMVALIGARNASSLGMRMARALSRDLGNEGFAITSGMARGIDTAAHDSALENGTIAVLGGGIDVIYPAENNALYERIAQAGVLISEQPMGMKPFARHFPQRNRIVSGMALATIVVEAAAKSGSLITANLALEQGRDVLAVPGHPFDGRSSGCNMLLRDGAGLVRGARDVLDVLANASVQALTEMRTPEEAIYPPTQSVTQKQSTPKQATVEQVSPKQTNPEELADLQTESEPAKLPKSESQSRPFEDHVALHTEILTRLGPTPISEDQLIRDLGLRAEHVSSELMALELDGKVKRQAGGLLALI